MQAQATAERDTLCVARGYGIKIRAERGHLVVEDGVGRDRRTRRYHRASSKLQRLVLIGHTGYLTLEALRWLRDKRAALLHIDSDGRLLAASIASGPDLAGLRRAQALAATSEAGVELARTILTAKVAGQRAVLVELPHGAAAVPAVETWLSVIVGADTLQELVFAESQAANAYWDAWASLPIPFPVREAAKLPGHWQTFGQRSSLISQGPRLATNPAGAIFNYVYALLEAETILACHAVGLDPGIGIFHTDRRDRASLALDLMEAVRPLADSYILALLTQRTFAPRDFVETRQGNCRLAPRLAAELAETLHSWRNHVAPVVEQAAHDLADSSRARLPRATPLTRSNQRASWDQRAPGRESRAKRAGHLTLPDSCRDCGGPVPRRGRRYCDQCRRDQTAAHVAKGREKAQAVLAQLRAEQRDPAHGGRAATIRGTKNAAHQRAVAAWEGERPDPEMFATEILPALRNLPVPDLMAATGLGQHYCSLIRLGKRIPHPRHWVVLRELSGPTS